MEILIAFSYKFLEITINLLKYSLFIHIILSWVSPSNKFSKPIDTIVEPLLKPFKWARIGILDFSVLITYIFLQYGGQFLLKQLAQLL